MAMILLGLISSAVLGNDNGLARIPPMGWSSWNAFHSGQIPLDEVTIRQQADAMVSSGLLAAGYRYVNIDDLWATGRDPNGTLVASASRFPSGMEALATYVHSKGLLFGLYTDVGTKTCGGSPGSFGHECQDARTFAEWGVDWIKEDHCSVPGNTNMSLDAFYHYSLGKMARCLNSTGRPILFDLCAHGCYDVIGGVDQKHNATCWSEWYRFAQATGNTWRTTTDIRVRGDGMWESVLRNWYRNDAFQDVLPLAQFAGPGHFNDPDSLVVGLPGLTTSQQRLHFSMWCLMAAPLIAGNDLRRMDATTRSILSHRGLIALNQDALGAQALRLQRKGARTNFTDVYGDPLARWEREVWVKPLLLYPGQYMQYGFALGLVNHGSANATVAFSAWDALARAFPEYFDSTAKFDSLELWSGRGAGDVVPGDTVRWEVEPDGVAVITLRPDC